jgi:hypothetical protein
VALTLTRLGKLAWAAPCSLVGLVVALGVAACGGRWHCGAETLEVTWRDSHGKCGVRARRFRFRAMALGHVILAITPDDLEHSRAHELVHVRQYERWGPVFFPAYAASSVWQWMRGRNAYLDNRFEVEARRNE